jgi:hypothetical protein
MKKLIIPALAAIMLAGCNASPGQFEGRVSPIAALFYFDFREYVDTPYPAKSAATAQAGSGHGSNARVTSESIQSMVLYKSPMSASSNSTPITAEIPLGK